MAVHAMTSWPHFQYPLVVNLCLSKCPNIAICDICRGGSGGGLLVPGFIASQSFVLFLSLPPPASREVQFMLTDKKIRPVHYGRWEGEILKWLFDCPGTFKSVYYLWQRWTGLCAFNILKGQLLICLASESFLPIVQFVLRICPLSMLGVSVTPKLVLSFSKQPTQTWDYSRSKIMLNHYFDTTSGPLRH